MVSRRTLLGAAAAGAVVPTILDPLSSANAAVSSSTLASWTHVDESTVDWSKVTYTHAQIGPRTWRILGDGCTCYLLAGSKHAILIDTGFGAKNIRAYAESIIRRPVAWAINTHGHWDHTGGNQYFDVVHMSREAELGAKQIYNSFKIRYSYDLTYPIRYVQEGSTIDLGGRVLNILSIPSHSPGDIAILDKSTKSIFTGDNVNTAVNLIYQQKTPQPTIEMYAHHMQVLQTYASTFTSIYAGHAESALTITTVNNLLANAKHVLAGNLGTQNTGTTDPDVQDGGDKITFQPTYKYDSTYAGTTLMYDKRYIHMP